MAHDAQTETDGLVKSERELVDRTGYRRRYGGAFSYVCVMCSRGCTGTGYSLGTGTGETLLGSGFWSCISLPVLLDCLLLSRSPASSKPQRQRERERETSKFHLLLVDAYIYTLSH